MSDTNPLLQFDALPDFTRIRPEHIRPAVEYILVENRRLVEELVQAPANHSAPDWLSLMEPLDAAEDRLDKVWSTASHLNAVNNTSDMREAYNAAQPLVTEYYSELGQNTALYECVLRLHEREKELGLSASQCKIISDTLLDFRLAGVALDEAQKTRFTALEQQLSRLSNEFGNNVLDATRAWTRHVTDAQILSGLPEMTLSAAADAARHRNLEGYLLTLDFPCYFAVMNNADNADLRREIYQAYATRASDQDDSGGKWDNSERMDQILAAREQLAEMLGYPDYAALSMARKMAGTPERVTAFLQDLIRYSRPTAEREYAELEAFAREEYGVGGLNAWDVPYFSEKLRKQNFDISQEELRVYFPAPQVRDGLFHIASRIYDIEIHRNTQVKTWDDQVEFYDIFRSDEQIASFFLDLFTREGKRGGAWMSGCRNRRRLEDGSIQLPVAHLVCNFAPPAAGEPALLTHNDVITLFHEFGHGLHHMLTREEHLRSAGIHGVAWDAVELPSQLMENWCWDREALGLISGHYQTGERLPETLQQKMLAAKNFQAGLRSMRQLEFALFDFELHRRASAAAISSQPPGGFVSGILAEARKQTAVYPVPDFNRFQNSFSHIFAGGYAAGYYSYKWAEVLSADVFSRFADQGVFSRAVGTEFLDKILSRGGGADALTLFMDFMGREPDLNALLQQEGLNLRDI
jgi:oligopeptidase A